MATDRYTPQPWVNGPGGQTPLSASRLNAIEAGIDTLDAAVQYLETQLGNVTAPTDPASQELDTGRVALANLGDVSGNVVLDLVTASAFRLRLTGAASINVIGWSPLQAIQRVEVIVIQDYVGSRAVTWPSTFASPATGAEGALPTVAPVAETISRYELVSADQGANVLIKHLGSFAPKDRYDTAVGGLWSLAYYLPLADASGTVATDASGQNRPGTYGGSGLTYATTATVPSSQRKAPNFAGAAFVSNDTVRRASTAGQPFTIGFTMRANDPGTTRAEIYSETSSTADGVEVCFGTSGALLANGKAQTRFKITDSATANQVNRNLSSSLWDGQPHEVIITSDGTNYVIYVDGTVDQTWAATPAYTSITTDRATWGARRASTNTRFLTGAVGRAWARTTVTSAAEAAVLHAAWQSGSGTTQPTDPGNGGGTTPTPTPEFDTNGVKLNPPVVTVNGSQVTMTATIETNKSVSTVYLQIAYRGAATGNTAYTNNVTTNGTRTITGTVTINATGELRAFACYSKVSNPAQSDWKDGPVTTVQLGQSSGGGGSIPGAVYLGGIGGETASASDFASWFGKVPVMAGCWADGDPDNIINVWAIRPGGPFGSWNRPLDIAIGALFVGDGESWSAAASGAYDARWRQSLTNLKTYWGTRDPALLYMRFGHEFNLSGSDWRVRGSDVSSYITSWRRFRALQKQIVPTAKLCWSPNDGTSSSLSLDVRTAWPGADYVDVVTPDSYNMWPWINDLSSFNSKINEVDSYGAPIGVEKWRRQAESWGKPLGFGEWGNSASDHGGSGGGDSPNYIQYFFDWMTSHAGTGPGQVCYANYFNLWDQFRLYPSTKQANAAAKYKQLFGA